MRCDFRKTPDGRWRCDHCGYITGRAYATEPKKNCLGPDAPKQARGGPHADPDHIIKTKLTATGLARLALCAGCSIKCKVNSQHVCTGLGGGKCQWMNRWASVLNGRTDFPTGSADCPLWPTASRESAPDPLG